MISSDKPKWQENISSAISASQNKATARFLQLATVDKDRKPAVRTVVFRGFLANTNSIIIHTDIRSEKVQQIATHNGAQICWYFVDPRLQFRVTGNIEIIQNSRTSKKHEQLIHEQWNSLSPEAKSSYETDLLTPTIAGPVVSSDTSSNTNDIKNTSNETRSLPSPHFAILLFHSTQVECLDLKPTPHTLITTNC